MTSRQFHAWRNGATSFAVDYSNSILRSALLEDWAFDRMAAVENSKISNLMGEGHSVFARSLAER